MAEVIEASTIVDGVLLYKSEIELKETISNKRKALENLRRLITKHKKSGRYILLLIL